MTCSVFSLAHTPHIHIKCFNRKQLMNFSILPLLLPLAAFDSSFISRTRRFAFFMAFRFVSRCYQCSFFFFGAAFCPAVWLVKICAGRPATHCMNHKLIKVFATTVCFVHYILSIFEVRIVENIKNC